MSPIFSVDYLMTYGSGAVSHCVVLKSDFYLHVGNYIPQFCDNLFSYNC